MTMLNFRRRWNGRTCHPDVEPQIRHHDRSQRHILYWNYSAPVKVASVSPMMVNRTLATGLPALSSVRTAIFCAKVSRPSP
ncbi:hypothetical protein ACH4S8_04155 [Streptomyces sp. NPDC021080]|uniref:hypothetical protein n=1 Tax=Streptomyces sp. NPDC021080 TaxID=3365110 RepID=UPI003793470E